MIGLLNASQVTVSRETILPLPPTESYPPDLSVSRETSLRNRPKGLPGVSSGSSCLPKSPISGRSVTSQRMSLPGDQLQGQHRGFVLGVGVHVEHRGANQDRRVPLHLEGVRVLNASRWAKRDRGALHSENTDLRPSDQEVQNGCVGTVGQNVQGEGTVPIDQVNDQIRVVLPSVLNPDSSEAWLTEPVST